MSNENVLLTQGGYFLPQSIGTYQPHPSLTPVNYYQAPVLHGVPGLDVFSRVVRSPSITENFLCVSLEELKALLPEDHPDEKIETGLLPDGRAYAPRSAKKDLYCLFPGKTGYILYFTHHYFSKENLDRDQYIQGMMDSNFCVPMDVVIKAPRLASVNTTIEELTSAIETGSDILVHITTPDGKSLLRRKDGYPGPSALSNASSLLPADGSTRASFDSRAGISERPTPSASVDPDIVPTLPAVPLQPVYGIQAAAPLDTQVIYPPPNAFFRPTNRPNSVSASVPTNPAITHLTAALTGMNLGQTPQAPPPTGNSHPPTQPPSQFFAPVTNFATAAAIAAINARNQNLAFANPFAPNLFASAAAGQGRPASGIHPSHQQFFHHPQQSQQRRVSPPPPPHTTSAPPPNVSANVLNLQLPGAPLYNMHNIHEAGAVPAHFAPSFPTQPYDSWLTDGANAALMNSNFHLQYASPSVMSGAPAIMAWPSNQPPPPQIRSASTLPPQHHQAMPIPYPQSQQPPNYQLFNVSNVTQGNLGGTASTGMSPTTSVSIISPVVSTSVVAVSDETLVSAKNAVTTMAGSISSSSASSSGKDEVSASMVSNAAVNEAPGPSNALQANSVSAKKSTVNHQQQQQPPTQHSRPNSSGSNKGNKCKSAGKSGAQHHHHQRASLHSNRGPGNTTLAPVSASATTTTTVTSSSASNAVSTPPPAPSPPAPPTTTVIMTTNK